jgi:hypothetical protein
MNSRQRRKARRYWKYDVIMVYANQNLDPYDARQWLEENMGKVGFRWSFQNQDPWWFSFHSGKDAAFFSMKWL